MSAQGTSDQKIVFTSFNDVAGSSTPAAAGDWQSLTFQDGSIDAGCAVSHIQIRYGHGIKIESASPGISDALIEHSIGAAIVIDLQSSPYGERLAATGNDLNGVLVPPGAILGDTTWNLTGIPYVVAQGDLEIGLAPFGMEPEALQLQAGSQGQLTVNLPYPAPAGGVPITIESSNASVASVPPAMSIVVPEGEHAVSFEIVAVAAGSATISAGTANDGPAQTVVTVLPLPGLRFNPSEATVGVGRSVQMTIQLEDGIATSDIPLTLSGPGLVFQPEQTISQGQSSTTFEITGLAIGALELTASSPGRAPATAAIAVEAVRLIAPSVALVVPETDPVILDVELSHPAPAEGVTVAVDNPMPGILSVQGVTVSSGATHALISLTGIQESASTVDLIISAPGYASATTKVTVQRIAVRLGDGTQDIVIPEGSTLSLPVVLSKPAPAGGLTINVQTSFPEGLAIAPTVVSIAEGQTRSASNVELHALGDSVSAVILSAQEAIGIDGIARVTVMPRVDLKFNLVEMIVGKGLQLRSGDIQLKCTIAGIRCNFSHPISIAVSNSLPAYVNVPVELTIAPGEGSVDVSIRGMEITGSQALISAEAPWADSPASLGVSVVAPVLTVQGLGGTPQEVGAARKRIDIGWSVPGSSSPYQRAPVDQTVSLSAEGVVGALYSASSGGSSITQTIILQGNAGAQTIFAASPQAQGTYQVHASADLPPTSVPTWLKQSPWFRAYRSVMGLGRAILARAGSLRMPLGFVDQVNCVV